MDSTEKAVLVGILGALLIIASAIVIGNTLAWKEYNDMLTIVGSEMSEGGFQEFMENELLKPGV